MGRRLRRLLDGCVTPLERFLPAFNQANGSALEEEENKGIE
jgi:hypothetical protein